VIPTNNNIPLLGFGTYPLLGQAAEDVVAMALDAGFRHIDTAQMYGNEVAVGAALQASKVSRDDLYIVTKVDVSNMSEGRFIASVKDSVEALHGPVDLLFLHWPPAIELLLPALDQLVEAKRLGFTKEIGVSNFSSHLMALAQTHTSGQIICNQVEFHPLLDQADLLLQANNLGIALAAYCPLARGVALKHEVVSQIATNKSVSASEVVLRWIIQQGVIAIPMTTKLENAKSNLRSLDFTLDESEMNAISAIGTRQGRLVAPEWMEGRW
jgi:2,5-diketo-D-gluconate reductase B